MLCLMLPHTKCGPNENEPHLLFTETEQYTVLVKNQSGVFDIPCLDVGVYWLVSSPVWYSIAIFAQVAVM